MRALTMDELEFVSGGFSGMSTPSDSFINNFGDSFDNFLDSDDFLTTVIVTGKRKKGSSGTQFADRESQRDAICEGISVAVSDHNSQQEVLGAWATYVAGVGGIGAGMTVAGLIPGGQTVAIAGGVIAGISGVGLVGIGAVAIVSTTTEARLRQKFRNMGCPGTLS